MPQPRLQGRSDDPTSLPGRSDNPNVPAGNGPASGPFGTFAKSWPFIYARYHPSMSSTLAKMQRASWSKQTVSIRQQVKDIAAVGRAESTPTGGTNVVGVSGINPRNSKGFFSAIADHGCLKSLSLHLQEDNDFVWLSDISPPDDLRCLKLYGHVDRLPQWDRHFQNLNKLSIEITKLLTQEDIQVVGKIQALQVLRLRFKTDQDCKLQFNDKPDRAASGTSDQFGQLKVLEITCSSSLHVKFAESAVKKLEQLKVHCLDGSALQFAGLEHPPSLKHVWLKGSFNDTVKEAVVRQVFSSERHVRANPTSKLERVSCSSR
ncbi:hypothetical protein C2845_PM05G17030 [Panicum miliaceum]|uniref:Disease resistance R13L4/SHOC-2-like LRR domain-containing protein n=1 Tax=Panicum miliaceum TaxID=4540 RepID=A0A3L6T0P0_PANMI|nr:hypothetical protein C2845_PM05G17030 [Panicum miliaceum]